MAFSIHRKILFGFCLVLTVSGASNAQFTFSGQLRTRTEYRNGQGTVLKEADKAAFFTSQRTRISAAYAGYRIKAFATVQDVRVWGQDASTINRTTNADLNGLMLHEAWGEFSLLDTNKTKLGKEFTLKIGRQELVYDDVRLLGNLDWLQQARRHDMALLKYSAKGWTAHVGIAYNQNRELKTGTVYNGIPTGYAAGTNGIGTAYKSLQFLYVGRKFFAGNASFLVIKDNFNQYITTPASGTVAATRINATGTWSRVTLGSYVNATFKKLSVKGEAYYQTGKDKDGRSLSADLHLQIKPGTDITLYHAIARGLIDRGLINRDFVDNHTEGFDALNEVVHKRSLKEAAHICGISLDDLRWAIEYIGRSKGFMSMWAMGLNQSVVGVNKNLSLLNVSLLTGQIGKPGAGPLSLTGQPNAMGGRETGGMANLLPAHRDMANPKHRQEVANFWGVSEVPAKPGYSAIEMFEALRDGRMKAVLDRDHEPDGQPA